MNIRLVKGTCENCSFSKKLPSLGDFSYGEFILRTIDYDEFSFFNAIGSTEYGDLKTICLKNSNFSSMNDSIKGNCIQILSTLIFDLSKKGKQYYLLNPPCPKCALKGKFKYEELENEWVELDEITFLNWNKKSANEREKVVLSELSKLLSH